MDEIAVGGLTDVVIRIADGTYYPDDEDNSDPPTHTNDDRDESFLLVDRVKIEGGYAGFGAPDPDARDSSVYVTILSGEIVTPDTPEDPTDNSKTVLRVHEDATAPATEVSGVTIRDGYGGTLIWETGGGGVVLEIFADADFENCIIRNNVAAGGVGGGFYAPSGNDCTIQDCQFIENESGDGGAVKADAANDVTDLRFENCLFEDNLVQNGVGGGAIAVKNAANVDIFDSVFTLNEVQFGEGGGAIFVCLGSTCEVRRAHFEDNLVNQIDGKGGAIYCDGVTPSGVSSVIVLDSTFLNNRVINRLPKGGAVYLASVIYSPLVSRLINCSFQGNSALHEAHAGKGGAIYVNGRSDHEIVNCLFFDNVAQIGGAGYIVIGLEQSPPVPPVVPRLINCTIAENSAEQEGGGLWVSNSSSQAFIRNCIVWGNTDGGSVVQDAQIFESNPFVDSDVRYSCIQDDDEGSSPFPYGGGSNKNIDLDPNFSDPEADDFHILSCSACVDAGDTTVTPADALNVDDDPYDNCGASCSMGERTPDLDLEQRVFAGYWTVGGGVPEDACEIGCGDIVDMGAYEARGPCDEAECVVRGDVNKDLLVNGLDIQRFVECVLGYRDPCDCVCGDMIDFDGVKFEDIPCFVNVLLGSDMCVDACPNAAGASAPWDCNENGINDANDIADCDEDPACEDCNGNFIPDGCDIENELSADLNENGVPDECEPDCNGNDVPDDKDIADQTSDDVNENGIPDECEPDCNVNGVPDDWDIAQETSADCNANGIPDECEFDCNASGVPDDCDINGYFTGETPVPPVSDDCNGNGLPDECDFELPIIPSLDCNENGIPDECDIADETSEDCNENGFPDECDIASEIREDENENGIPDECEQQQAQGGGPEPAAISAESSQAWEKFWAWSAEQTWGPGAEIGPAAQFQLLVDKLAELELPLGNPWVVAAPAPANEE